MGIKIKMPDMSEIKERRINFIINTVILTLMTILGLVLIYTSVINDKPLLALLGGGITGIAFIPLIERFYYTVLQSICVKFYMRRKPKLLRKLSYSKSEYKSIVHETCMYCGKAVKLHESGNPEDYGLHTPYIDFSNKVVCRECDFVVTQTNRLLKCVIDGENREESIERLKEHMEQIPNIYE